MKASLEKMGTTKISEDREARLAYSEGVILQGDSEHRRTGCDKKENKAASSECRNTDHFKAQCPIWISERKRRNNENPTPKGGNRKDRKKTKEKEAQAR